MIALHMHMTVKETKLRQSISPSKCLCVTLPYLVTGEASVTIGIFNIVQTVKPHFFLNN